MSPSASEALRYDAVRAPFDGWSVLEVGGRHRERYLHSQLTSDVDSLEIGRSQLSALLDATGRLRSFFFVLKLEDSVRLLLPEAAVAETIRGLEANLVADDVTIRSLDLPSMTLVLGPTAVELRKERAATETFPVTGYGAPALVVLGDPREGYPEIDPDELEARRVLGGVPRWGVEAASGMLVNETTLVDTAVSFTKGCYLGQETVAKVASRRGAAYAPMLLALAPGSPLSAELEGQDFSVGERRRAGTVRSGACWEGKTYLQVSLWRELRVDGTRIECLFQDGRTVHAEVSSLPLLTDPPPDRVAGDLYQRAAELFAADDEDGALALLRRSLVVCPEHADSYESLGVILGRHQRFEEAIELMDRLLEVDPDSVMAHTNKSVYLNQLGRNDEAEEEARLAAAKSFELSRRVQREALQTELAGEDRQEADRRRREEMFRQVLELDAADAMANFGLGQLLVELEEWDDAVTHLQTALDADPEYSAAYLALGRALEGLGDMEKARSVYRDGVRVAARRGDLKTANTMQHRLAEMSPINPT